MCNFVDRLVFGAGLVAAGVAGVALERFWLGRRRESVLRQQQAEAQLQALGALAERLDDDFEVTISSTGAVLTQQLTKVHNSVDNLLCWVEALPVSGEFPALQDEWRQLQHKVHRLNLEILRFAKGLPKRRWMLEDSDTVDTGGAAEVAAVVRAAAAAAEARPAAMKAATEAEEAAQQDGDDRRVGLEGQDVED